MLKLVTVPLHFDVLLQDHSSLQFQLFQWITWITLPLILNSQRQPTEVMEPPSPALLSPAISPDREEVECVEDMFVRESARRRRSYLDSELSTQAPDPPHYRYD